MLKRPPKPADLDDEEPDDETKAVTITGIRISLLNMVEAILTFYVASCLASVIAGVVIGLGALALSAVLMSAGITLPSLPHIP